ncbi:MAG: SpoIVFB-regulator protein [Bacilli bacterium]|nr:SpoIVFB-regulator protein [Bacilli bacterium]
MEIKDQTNEPRAWLWMPTQKQIQVKLCIALLLFICIFAMFQFRTPWAEQGQEYVNKALTKEIAFQAVEAWYQSKFSGTPSFIPSFHAPQGQEAEKVDALGLKSFYIPVHGKIVIPYASDHQAIVIQTQANASVCAMDTGRVIYAGYRVDTGNTVILQHASGYQSTYGNLQPLQWEKNDWITVGEEIGKASIPKGQLKGNVYLAVMKDAEYVNPVDVITFD